MEEEGEEMTNSSKQSTTERRQHLIAQATRIFPDMGRLADHLNDETRFAHLLAAAPKPNGGAASLGLREAADALEQLRGQTFESGKTAVSKIRDSGAKANLAPDEESGLEAVVLTAGRPALLIQDGKFSPAPFGWEALEAARPAIEHACLSVGRIDLTGNPMYPWVGTGFLVGKDVVMTNRHVAQAFSASDGKGKWVFDAGMTASIDYQENPDVADSPSFALTEVIGVHESFDLALLRISTVADQGASLPEPLPIASTPPSTLDGHKVYTIGYPAQDPRNDPAVMRSIFADVYNVKRLEPGEIMTYFDDQSTFRHDCSTLGGNSGSCVFDLLTSQVIGLHFKGFYLQYNVAVALWKLCTDPLLKQASVNFA